MSEFKTGDRVTWRGGMFDSVFGSGPFEVVKVEVPTDLCTCSAGKQNTTHSEECPAQMWMTAEATQIVTVRTPCGDKGFNNTMLELADSAVYT